MAILLIHGGAGTFTAGRDEAYEAGLSAACEAGYALLTSGSTAVSAVIEAVRRMESNPEAFNAGVGGAMTRTGDVELDACVMLSDGSAGAVGGVRTSRNPVLLADLVRTTTPHVVLFGAGAEALEKDPVANDELKTPHSRAELERWQASTRALTGTGTVGAVALADDGTLAAATSTGGIVGQYLGRIGDTPIPGAGTWADARTAVSGTGACKRVSDELAHGATLEAALHTTLTGLVTADGSGGLIVVTSDGSFGYGFNTPAMAYAFRAPGLSEHGLSRSAGVRIVRT
jgi:beta-aspartyl-peptidase (threonine type)